MAFDRGSSYFGQLSNDAQGSVSRQECWSCAWSSCGNYFGWSKGHQQVDVIDWAACKVSDSHARMRARPNVVTNVDCGSIVWTIDFCWCEIPVSGIDEDIVESTGNGKQRTLVLAVGLENGCIRMYNALGGELLSELHHYSSKSKSMVC